MPADPVAQVKKTRRFHCKEMGCSETFPKKAALVQHLDENHSEKGTSSDQDSIQKFKMAVKKALSQTLPKELEGEIRVGKADRPHNKGSEGQYNSQETSHKEGQVSTGKDKSDVSCQGQVVMMVWAGNDGEEALVNGNVESQGVVVEEVETPGSSSTQYGDH